MNQSRSARGLARGAMIAAIYAGLTLILQPLSFGAVQFRVAEALTVLPILTADAIPGLAVGCLLANLLCGAPWFDVVFGTFATLIAALLTRRFRKKPLLAMFMPVLANGLIVGPVVCFAYTAASGMALLGTSIAAVAAGEAVVCLLLGRILYDGLKDIRKLWE